MEPLHVGHAAAHTGWSARMLRYLEQAGLVVPSRTPAGYRLYGLRELNQPRSPAEPRAGPRICPCLHVTTETANLMRTLQAGGADVVLCASNPLSTQDDVAAALVAEYDVSVFATTGEDTA